VRLVGFNFAPVDWEMCQGQIVDIASNATLFNLIGTIYGGDGMSNFGLPDLRGRVTVHQGQGQGLQNYVIGQKSGVEQVTLTQQNYPAHKHPLIGSSDAATSNNPAGNTVAGGSKIYDAAPGALSLSPQMVSLSGGTNGPMPHENRQPFQVLNWIIAMNGIYPSQS
jgi:microcystin-dependent protein